MVVLLEVSPISIQDLWSSARVTIEVLFPSLTKAVLATLLNLAMQPALGRVYLFQTSSISELWFVLSGTFLSRSVARRNPVFELCRQFF